jgi:hypothetical protein
LVRNNHKYFPAWSQGSSGKLCLIVPPIASSWHCTSSCYYHCSLRPFSRLAILGRTAHKYNLILTHSTLINVQVGLRRCVTKKRFT